MDFLKTAVSAIKKAGKLTAKNFNKKQIVTEKQKNDFVTEIDRLAENLIIKEISKKYPTHDFLAEEINFQKKFTAEDYAKSKYIWIIDPIDGTNNFIRGIPFYCISIALFKTSTFHKSRNFNYLSGEVILGAIFAPQFNKLYYAEKGKGAYLNDKKIHVTKTEKLYRSVLATGFHGEYKLLNLPYFEKIIRNSQGIRRVGSAALDLCMVAEGKYEGYWEFGLKPWDIAAGVLIVEEAGGRVTDTNGKLLDLFGKDLLATNKKIHREVVKLFS